MKKVKFSVGIDISCNYFTITILTFTLLMIAQDEFLMNEEGFQQFALWLKKNKVTRKNSHIVMEATGVYVEQLCLYLHNNGFSFSVGSPLKVKKSFGARVNINDWIASKCIAEYGIRYADELTQWQPPDQILDQVRMLLSFREQLVKTTTAYRNRTHAIKKKIIKSQSILDDIKKLLETTRNIIIQLEKEVSILLKSDAKLGSIYLRLRSIPGVGLILAGELMVLTSGFSKTLNHKQIAGYLGICPAKKESGKDKHRTAKSTGFGPKRLRRIMFLVAGSVCYHNKYFKEYFQRKLLAGKKPILILNNIANKMLKIICGVVKSGKPYICNYQSLPPALAA